MLLNLLLEALRTSVLVTGLVIIMMMLIEVVNIWSGGRSLAGLRGHRIGQVLLSAFLGIIPGCMGGYASVSLYTHGLLSFGALTAMMIASSGDEAFVMLAMFPERSLWIFVTLFVVAVGVGVIVDLFNHKEQSCHSLNVHDVDLKREHVQVHCRHFGWKRILMLAGVLLFIVMLLTGLLEDEHIEAHSSATTGGFNLLSEEWMYWMFAILAIIVAGVLIIASDHFVEEHIWEHIVCHHLPSIFLWSFSTIVVIGYLTNLLNIQAWIGNNIPVMILLAALVGIIPESGPHMVFVSLYATGVIPLPVLLASCISQDGHASLPLLAESRPAFIKAKLINVAVAILVGFCSINLT